MKMLRFVPVLSAIVAGAVGWLAGGTSTLFVLVPLAILNVLVLAGDRMRQVRGPEGTDDANPVLEGFFLFILQIAILGFAYLLGFLLGNAVPLLSL